MRQADAQAASTSHSRAWVQVVGGDAVEPIT